MAQTPMITKRCSVCGRFRHYHDDDSYCLICGNDALDSHCSCGRNYDYALSNDNEGATLHCPRCGKSLRGRSPDFEG
jgi:hypothetical protein